MMRVGYKRRRTRQEIDDEKEEARLKEMAIEKKLSEYDSMKAMLE